jgi:hypothetical protein
MKKNIKSHLLACLHIPAKIKIQKDVSKKEKERNVKNIPKTNKNEKF